MKSCLEGKLKFKNLKPTSITFEAGVAVCVFINSHLFSMLLVNKITKTLAKS